MAEKKSTSAKKPAVKKSTTAAEKTTTKKTTTKKEATKKPVEVKKSVEKTNEKKPWSTKKKVIFWSCLGGGIVLAAVLVVVLVIIFTRVDYKEAYEVAGELKTEISDLSSSSCSKVVSSVSSSYTTEKDYTKYIDKCKEAMSGVSELTQRLENTSAVQRDEKINKQWVKFKKEYDEVIGNTEKRDQALNLYATWHKWILAYDDVDDYDESDADLEAAAKILADSGNNDLKEYGETWLKYKKDLAKAYRAYKDVSYSADNYNDVYNAYSKARSDYSNWYYKNSIKIAELADWKFSMSSDMYNEFSDLYKTIETAYKNGNGGDENSKLEEMIKKSGSSQNSGSGYSEEDLMKLFMGK